MAERLLYYRKLAVVSNGATVGANDPSEREQRLRERLRQLVLMRETGPKRPAWHRERLRLIWRTHAELAREAQARSLGRTMHPEDAGAQGDRG
jgi:hypothetical protein